ncbi:hypothetical protein BH11PSE7_BH11PSE7_06010 [soil metagenome]
MNPVVQKKLFGNFKVVVLACLTALSLTTSARDCNPCEPSAAAKSAPSAIHLEATPPAFELNLRGPGQYYDKESGLIYNNQRTYAPNQGRFIQPDPMGLGGGLSRFNYVNGDPLRNTDPEGLQTSVDAAIRNAIGKGDMAELRALAEAANTDQAALIQRAMTPARDLIRGQTKRAASYASELEDLSYAEICQTAKGTGELANKAAKMKKLIEQQERLLGK